MTPRTNPARWRKSNRSGGTNGNCVELANTLDAARDSKNPNGPTLNITLTGLITAIKVGHFDR